MYIDNLMIRQNVYRKYKGIIIHCTKELSILYLHSLYRDILSYYLSIILQGLYIYYIISTGINISYLCKLPHVQGYLFYQFPCPSFLCRSPWLLSTFTSRKGSFMKVSIILGDRRERSEQREPRMGGNRSERSRVSSGVVDSRPFLRHLRFISLSIPPTPHSLPPGRVAAASPREWSG